MPELLTFPQTCFPAMSHQMKQPSFPFSLPLLGQDILWPRLHLLQYLPAPLPAEHRSHDQLALT